MRGFALSRSELCTVRACRGASPNAHIAFLIGMLLRMRCQMFESLGVRQPGSVQQRAPRSRRHSQKAYGFSQRESCLLGFRDLGFRFCKAYKQIRHEPGVAIIGADKMDSLSPRLRKSSGLVAQVFHSSPQSPNPTLNKCELGLSLKQGCRSFGTSLHRSGICASTLRRRVRAWTQRPGPLLPARSGCSRRACKSP